MVLSGFSLNEVVRFVKNSRSTPRAMEELSQRNTVPALIAETPSATTRRPISARPSGAGRHDLSGGASTQALGSAEPNEIVLTPL